MSGGAALRHTRQARLAEVGDAGQARLLAARVTVPGVGLAERVEARYLAGAGVSVVTGAAVDSSRPLCPPWLDDLDPAARAVAQGAARALSTIKTILSLDRARGDSGS